MVSEGKLVGSRAIVTGAAQGFGESIARLFAHEGASVGVADLNLEGAKQIASEVEASGGSAFAIAVLSSLRNTWQQSLGHMGSLQTQ